MCSRMLYVVYYLAWFAHLSPYCSSDLFGSRIRCSVVSAGVKHSQPTRCRTCRAGVAQLSPTKSFNTITRQPMHHKLANLLEEPLCCLRLLQAAPWPESSLVTCSWSRDTQQHSRVCWYRIIEGIICVQDPCKYIQLQAYICFNCLL